MNKTHLSLFWASLRRLSALIYSRHFIIFKCILLSVGSQNGPRKLLGSTSSNPSKCHNVSTCIGDSSLKIANVVVSLSDEHKRFWSHKTKRQGRVVRKPVNVNPGLKFNCSTLFSCMFKNVFHLLRFVQFEITTV